MGEYQALGCSEVGLELTQGTMIIFTEYMFIVKIFFYVRKY